MYVQDICYWAMNTKLKKKKTHRNKKNVKSYLIVQGDCFIVFYRSDNDQLISKGYTIPFLTMTEKIADMAYKNGGGAGIFMPYF
jgi:hypothetical protein